MENQPNKNKKRLERLYSIMFFILDVENALVTISDFLIRPVKMLRGVFVYKINNLLQEEKPREDNKNKA